MGKLTNTIILTVLFFLLVKTSDAQLKINEFMASNSNAVEDTLNNEYSDWLEIYNSGNSKVDMSGYTLTDNFGDSIKWKFPAGIEIAAKGYLVVWADGLNTGLHTNFKLAAEGEELALFNTKGTLIDSVSFGLQEPNISTGRKPDGGNDWVLFTEPTPGKSNTTNGYSGIVKNSPRFSPFGGIFSSQQTVQLVNTFGGTIRYTLDGSKPTINSPEYSKPFILDKTTVIRACIFKNNQLNGPVVTHTYFIDPNNEIGSLPVFSIVSDPDNFWDSEKGIYSVHDSKPSWEIPINIELFENDGSDRAAFNLPAGAKSTGLYSWQLPEKMLGISFRKEYGASKLEYPLIFDKGRRHFDTFSLRASGSDWGSTMFRDGMIQTASAENTHIDISGFRASVVYINGQYMGVHNIREKIDEDYVVGNHGLEAGSFDMIEETDNGHYAETGDFVANDYFLGLAAKDLTNQENYNALANEMDIEEFTEMVCTEVYSGNSSIGHNLMKWKPKGTGKWKWILMDLDRGFKSTTGQLISFYLNESDWPFKQLMKNPDYKKMFGLKLADLLFTTFNPDRMVARIENHKKTIEAEMPKHIERWKGTKGTGNYSSISAIPSVDYWYSEVDKLKAYAVARPNVVLADLTNYGFQPSVSVTVATVPANAGLLTFNNLKIPVDVCSGGYPIGETIKLSAKPKAGYKFLGWAGSNDSVLIEKEQSWKYSDSGTDLGTTWRGVSFSDSQWKTGTAEFGYGDNDEQTVISYGSSSSNKYPTYYFRKSFALKSKQSISGLLVSLKCDDGAVVYLNGIEVVRYNMPTGTIGFESLASTSVADSDESDFQSFALSSEQLINGNNVIAVEIHQNSRSSADISFDLELTAKTDNTSHYLSTNKDYTVTIESNVAISAIFEKEANCTLPSEITGSITLSKTCSPVIVPENVVVKSGGKLIIEEGVELQMADGVSLIVNGALLIKGTAKDPVVFQSWPNAENKQWGVISFVNATDTSKLNHFIIKNASMGKHPVREVAAISAFNSKLVIDNAIIEDVQGNPISARYSDVKLTNSSLHSVITGDLVNFKYGNGLIDGCTFVGNDMPDTDAIDYDDVENGIIRNSTIKDFHGFNSDGIDIGEQAKNVNIENLFVYSITDKGISVGQQSDVKINNSVFVNCNLGAGLKDSSRVTIDHCTYYGVGTAVACFEKNVGDAGGNVTVSNSILSNSYTKSWSVDNHSTIRFSNSLADNDSLPAGNGNKFGNPSFVDPNMLNFSLKPNSPCIGTATNGNMGASLVIEQIPQLYISGINYFTDLVNATDFEFIKLSNAGNYEADISGYTIADGVEYVFPVGTKVPPKGNLYITNNASETLWQNHKTLPLQWTSGRLADEGEAIELHSPTGIVIDRVRYKNKTPWPVLSLGNGIQLKAGTLDNHFGENWQATVIENLVGVEQIASQNEISIFPNTTKGLVNISGVRTRNEIANVYSLSGKKLISQPITEGLSTIDLAHLEHGLYLVKVGNQSKKVLLIE